MSDQVRFYRIPWRVWPAHSRPDSERGALASFPPTFIRSTMRPMRFITVAAFAAGALVAGAPAASAQAGHHHPPASAEKLGSVSFPTTCKPEVQQRFERAVAMLHSFWFEEANRAFQDVAAADP